MDNTGPHSTTNTREQLILAGLEELNQYGIRNFSTRRVAKNCGISCAAPYKHFQNTQEFIGAILDYVEKMYSAQQKEILVKYAHCDSRTQLLQASLDYIRFLVQYPELRRVIMQNFKDCDEVYHKIRGQFSYQIYKIVSRYCLEVHMPDDVRKRKTFTVRSIIFGAALFFDNGEMEYTQENMDMVASILNREFDLP